MGRRRTGTGMARQVGCPYRWMVLTLGWRPSRPHLRSARAMGVESSRSAFALPA
jgi:hypothetical protein